MHAQVCIKGTGPACFLEHRIRSSKHTSLLLNSERWQHSIEYSFAAEAVAGSIPWNRHREDTELPRWLSAGKAGEPSTDVRLVAGAAVSPLLREEEADAGRWSHPLGPKTRRKLDSSQHFHEHGIWGGLAHVCAIHHPLHRSGCRTCDLLPAKRKWDGMPLA